MRTHTYVQSWCATIEGRAGPSCRRDKPSSWSNGAGRDIQWDWRYTACPTVCWLSVRVRLGDVHIERVTHFTFSVALLQTIELQLSKWCTCPVCIYRLQTRAQVDWQHLAFSIHTEKLCVNFSGNSSRQCSNPTATHQKQSHHAITRHKIPAWCRATLTYWCVHDI